MNRDEALKQAVESQVPWEVIVIGGGATGLGAAVEAAARGYRTVLIEQSDFAKATSSRSTKLIHGGVRYLKQGNLHLVLDSLRERGLLVRNAPHLVHRLSFIVPNYKWWDALYYGAGLKLYELLSGRLSLGPSRHVSREKALQLQPALEASGLRGGIQYYDGQFDDARLAVCLAQTLMDLGGTAMNYVAVKSLLKANNRVCGVVAADAETGREFEIRGRAIINATGIFTDNVRRMDEADAAPLLTTSQGIHLVLDKSFLPGDSAIMVPETDDGRVLFAIPWHGRAVIGTTDTPMTEMVLEPKPLESEIEFLLEHAARYLSKKPRRTDILSIFAGLRPLVRSVNTGKTSKLSRDHAVITSASGLVSVTGGKWTTYRKMGEDAIHAAAKLAGLESQPSRTAVLHLHGWTEAPAAEEAAGVYGAEAEKVRALCGEKPEWNELLHQRLPYRAGEIIWAARYEMARTVEDVLARRLRGLLLDARASSEAAPRVAALLAAELKRDEAWQARQIADFRSLARSYLPG